jgi:hypothetical protein
MALQTVSINRPHFSVNLRRALYMAVTAERREIWLSGWPYRSLRQIRARCAAAATLQRLQGRTVTYGKPVWPSSDPADAEIIVDVIARERLRANFGHGTRRTIDANDRDAIAVVLSAAISDGDLQKLQLARRLLNRAVRRVRCMAARKEVTQS